MFETYPDTKIGILIGVIIGLALPSGADIFLQIDWSNFLGNPEQAILGTFIFWIVEIISGFVGGITGGVIGLIMDSSSGFD